MHKPTGNDRYDHFRKLHPDAPQMEYTYWLNRHKQALVDAARWDVVVVRYGGDVAIRDHAAFTTYLLEQTA